MSPLVNPDDDPLSPKQGIFVCSPGRHRRRFAWTQADGSGIGFVDLEQGWTLDHEDLPSPTPVIGTGSFLQALEWIAHGTAVLGLGATPSGRNVAHEARLRSERVIRSGKRKEEPAPLAAAVLRS